MIKLSTALYTLLVLLLVEYTGSIMYTLCMTDSTFGGFGTVMIMTFIPFFTFMIGILVGVD